VQHQVRARRDPHGSGQLRLLLDDHSEVFLLDVFTWSQLVVVDHDHGLVVFDGLVVFGGLNGLDERVRRNTMVMVMSGRWRGDGMARRVGLAVGVRQVARWG